MRWTDVRLVVAARDGRESAADGAIREPDDADPDVIVPALILAVLLVTAFVFPPCLMFNLPILFVRAAWSYFWRDTYERLRVGAFACPACGASQVAFERAGVLPVDVPCAACGASLAIRRAPRRNLVTDP